MPNIISSETLTVDPDAKKLPDLEADGFRVLKPVELEGIKLRELFIHDEDNDMEAWYLSQGGQFIRHVGKPDARWMHMSDDEAWFIIQDYLDDETLSRLQDAGFFKDSTPAP